MKSDGIKRHRVAMSDANLVRFNESKTGGWCHFADVEALVDTLINSETRLSNRVVQLEEEIRLMNEFTEAASNLMAHDIQTLSTLVVMPIAHASVQRLNNFADRLRS